MRTRILVLTLSLSVLALVGCKATSPAVPQQVHYGAVIPATQTNVVPQSAPPPLAPPASRLPN